MHVVGAGELVQVETLLIVHDALAGSQQSLDNKQDVPLDEAGEPIVQHETFNDGRDCQLDKHLQHHCHDPHNLPLVAFLQPITHAQQDKKDIQPNEQYKDGQLHVTTYGKVRRKVALVFMSVAPCMRAIAAKHVTHENRQQLDACKEQ